MLFCGLFESLNLFNSKFNNKIILRREKSVKKLGEAHAVHQFSKRTSFILFKIFNLKRYRCFFSIFFCKLNNIETINHIAPIFILFLFFLFSCTANAQCLHTAVRLCTSINYFILFSSCLKIFCSEIVAFNTNALQSPVCNIFCVFKYFMFVDVSLSVFKSI